jgi:pimeloyl-ACP methyl ester carboxylesterase
MPERQFFDSNGVRLSYLDCPASSDLLPLVMVHGFASNATVNWLNTGWFRHFEATGRRLVAIDNRGHGESAKLYELNDYGAPLMAEDVRRLMDHLGLEAAHVIGYSMGARISAFLTLAHPDRVASVVFGGLGINMVRGMAGTGPIAHALEAATIDDVVNPTARTFRAFAEQTRSDLKALAACIRSARAPLTADKVQTIASPALVVTGDRDVIAGPAEDLAALLPRGRAVTLLDRDHMKAVGDAGFKAEVETFLTPLG